MSRACVDAMVAAGKTGEQIANVPRNDSKIAAKIGEV